MNRFTIGLLLGLFATSAFAQTVVDGVTYDSSSYVGTNSDTTTNSTVTSTNTNTNNNQATFKCIDT